MGNGAGHRTALAEAAAVRWARSFPARRRLAASGGAGPAAIATPVPPRPFRLRRARRWAKVLAFLGLTGTGAWAIGFVWFAWQAYSAAPPPPPPYADGIVALTGGADRVGTAMRLLSEGRAPVLLISGVPPRGLRGPQVEELAQLAGLDPAPLAGRITLGHAATTTVGNADETAEWAQRLGLRSILVVTASYHMPRALLELGRALPGVDLHPVPVLPPALRGPGTRGTLPLLVGEYNKLLGAELGLARLRGGAGA